MDTVLEVRNIYKFYGKLAANKDVNLSITKGTKIGRAHV